MENIFKINRIFVVILISLLVLRVGYSQASFVVHKVIGEPYLQVNDSIKSLTKGSLIDKSAILTMNRDDVVHYINDEGELFKLLDTGSFSYEDLQNIPALQNNPSFLRESFSYLWKELTNTLAVRNKKSGVVYRGEELVVKLNPVDSALIAGNEIRFEWVPKEGKEKDYYFILKDVSSGLTTVIGTPSTKLTLIIDGTLLKYGNQYDWTIAETQLPEKDFPFSSFQIGSKEEIKNSMQKIKQIYSFLSKNGYSKDEIRNISCQEFKICF